jgi:hypothetical protein
LRHQALSFQIGQQQRYRYIRLLPSGIDYNGNGFLIQAAAFANIHAGHRIQRLYLAAAILVASDPAIDTAFADPCTRRKRNHPFSLALFTHKSPSLPGRKAGTADKLVNDTEAKDGNLPVFIFRHQKPSFRICFVGYKSNQKA